MSKENTASRRNISRPSREVASVASPDPFSNPFPTAWDLGGFGPQTLRGGAPLLA
jgi:hypothetical protein